MECRITEHRRTCKTCGIEKDADEFKKKAHGRVYFSSECRQCRSDKANEWNKAHLEQRRERRRWIADDDPYTDLVPMTAGGFARWAVISTDRRTALGELAPHSGKGIGDDE